MVNFIKYYFWTSLPEKSSNEPIVENKLFDLTSLFIDLY